MLRLDNGAAFPPLTFDTVSDGVISVTRHLAGFYGTVLMYRGSWCPYCNAQLAAFSRARDKLDEFGIRAIALSVDDRATSAALVEKHRLSFPVGRRCE